MNEIKEIKETRIYKLVNEFFIKPSNWLNKNIKAPLKWAIKKLINHFFVLRFLRTLLFPFRLLNQEFFLAIWIVTTLFGGLFTLFADVLLGIPTAVEETIRTGNIYIFSITLLIPTIADCLLFFYAEEKYREYMENKQNEFQTEKIEKEMVPLLNIDKITKYVIVILSLSFLVIVISMFLYLGKYKSEATPQIVSAILSVYITFYYFCLNRVSQYKNNYKDETSYTQDEDEEMEKIRDKNDDVNLSNDNKQINALKTLSKMVIQGNDPLKAHETAVKNFVQPILKDDWDNARDELDVIAEGALNETPRNLDGGE